MAEARRGAGGAESRIVLRAQRLGEVLGLAAAIRAWRGRMRFAAAGAALLMFAGGVGAALGVAGNGAAPINVVWALGALLGLHVVSLLLWCASFLPSGGGAGGLGALWAWVSRRLAGDDAEVAVAFAGLQARAGITRWWFGVAAHGLWSAALAGALAGLLATFLLRGHVFTWETTLLPADFFVRFVELAGWLPAKLGFGVPGAEVVVASGAAPLDDEAARRLWASWLVGCVIAYGLVPRLLLWGGCMLRLRAGRAALRLDTTLPGFAALAAELAPSSERIGVTDAAPRELHVARVEGARSYSGEAAVVGIELRADCRWPQHLPDGVRDGGIADGREERARVLAELAAAPVRRLLVACDPRLSPDRSSLGLIADLSRHAGSCRVWLIEPREGVDEDRGMRWHEALNGIGLADDEVFDDFESAFGWLEGRHAKA